MADCDQLLWCCHVRGPDDVHAAESYKQAREWADNINFKFAPHEGVKPHKYDPIIIAAPMIWPWSPQEHAEGVEDFYRQEMIRRLKVWRLQMEEDQQ